MVAPALLVEHISNFDFPVNSGETKIEKSGHMGISPLYIADQ
jgi:hypothetical protein